MSMNPSCAQKVRCRMSIVDRLDRFSGNTMKDRGCGRDIPRPVERVKIEYGGWHSVGFLYCRDTGQIWQWMTFWCYG